MTDPEGNHLRALQDRSFDAAITDLQTGHSKLSVEQLEAIQQGGGPWPQIYRALKPGGHVLVFARTWAWDLVSLCYRAAGFEFRDTIANVYPGPSWEPILVFRKPLEGTVVDNVLKHGTGALNIDGCRVDYSSRVDREGNRARPARGQGDGNHGAGLPHHSADWGAWQGGKGRWPPNAVMTHAPGCKRVGTKRIKGSHDTTGVWGAAAPGETYGDFEGDPQQNRQGYTDDKGREVVDSWSCVEGCPVRALDGQSGELRGGKGGVRRKPWSGFKADVSWITGEPEVAYGDSGGASRFFPQFGGRSGLMRWLVRLVCPKDGAVLFLSNSGIMGSAADLEGVRWIGVGLPSD